MSLRTTVAIYRAAHGAPEYRYFKRRVQWTKFRRRPGYHSTPIGDGDEVTEVEYEANIAQTKHYRGEAFMGRYPQSYLEYHRKMVKDGWRERLIKDVARAGLRSRSALSRSALRRLSRGLRQVRILRRNHDRRQTRRPEESDAAVQAQLITYALSSKDP